MFCVIVAQINSDSPHRGISTMLNEIPRTADSFQLSESHTRAIIYTCWKSFWGARPGPGPSVHLHLQTSQHEDRTAVCVVHHGGVWCRPERVVPSSTTNEAIQASFCLWFNSFWCAYAYICPLLLLLFIAFSLHMYMHTYIHTYTNTHTTTHTYSYTYTHMIINT